MMRWRSPLDVESFEFISTGEATGLARLTARWRGRAAASPELVVSAGGGEERIPLLGPVGHPEGMAPGTFVAAFSVPERLAADPDVRFSLVAADLSVDLPAPERRVVAAPEPKPAASPPKPRARTEPKVRSEVRPGTSPAVEAAFRAGLERALTSVEELHSELEEAEDARAVLADELEAARATSVQREGVLFALRKELEAAREDIAAAERTRRELDEARSRLAEAERVAEARSREVEELRRELESLATLHEHQGDALAAAEARVKARDGDVRVLENLLEQRKRELEAARAEPDRPEAAETEPLPRRPEAATAADAETRRRIAAILTETQEELQIAGDELAFAREAVRTRPAPANPAAVHRVHSQLTRQADELSRMEAQLRQLHERLWQEVSAADRGTGTS